MVDKELLPPALEIDEKIFAQLPPAVLQLFLKLLEHLAKQEKRINTHLGTGT